MFVLMLFSDLILVFSQKTIFNIQTQIFTNFLQKCQKVAKPLILGVFALFDKNCKKICKRKNEKNINSNYV